MKKILSLVFIAILAFGLSAAGNKYQSEPVDLSRYALSGYDDASGYYETQDQVTYVFKATWVDSTDDLHSQPFFIGDLNANDAYCRAIVSAASDVNIIYHFSYDNCNTWVSVIPATFDALSNTAVSDTIGIEAGIDDGVGFHTGVWMIVEFTDGSTALNDAEVCTWVASFRKDGTYVTGYQQPSVTRVLRHVNTKP